METCQTCFKEYSYEDRLKHKHKEKMYSRKDEKIYIKYVSASKISQDVLLSFNVQKTVAELKTYLGSANHTQNNKFLIVYQKILLEDKMQLCSYGITQYSKIVCYIKK